MVSQLVYACCIVHLIKGGYKGLQKNLRKFVRIGGTMLYTNLLFQSFPTLHSARIASLNCPSCSASLAYLCL